MSDFAICGTCGRGLPMIDGRAFTGWHFCRRQLKGGRQIVINVNPEGGFDVVEGDTFADRLGFDEMLGQIVELLHPEIGRAHYRMMTAEQWKQLYPWKYRKQSEEDAQTKD
jgi:hypothetical protein